MEVGCCVKNFHTQGWCDIEFMLNLGPKKTNYCYKLLFKTDPFMRKPLFFVAIALGMAAGPCYAQRAALPSPLQGAATACGVKAEVKSEFASSPARVQVPTSPAAFRTK